MVSFQRSRFSRTRLFRSVHCRNLRDFPSPFYRISRVPDVFWLQIGADISFTNLKVMFDCIAHSSKIEFVCIKYVGFAREIFEFDIWLAIVQIGTYRRSYSNDLNVNFPHSTRPNCNCRCCNCHFRSSSSFYSDENVCKSIRISKNRMISSIGQK